MRALFTPDPCQEQNIAFLTGLGSFVVQAHGNQQPKEAGGMIATGIVYAFVESTLEGKLVLLTLFLASIFSWSVMVTKFRYLHFAKKQNERFSALFHRDRAPLRIYEQGVRFDGSPLFAIYEAGTAGACSRCSARPRWMRHSALASTAPKKSVRPRCGPSRPRWSARSANRG